MTASRHTSRVTIDGTQFDTSRLTLDIDELRRPYAQASFTAALPSLDVLDRLDPRQSPPVRVTMRQQFNDSRPLSAISADYEGGTLRDMAVWSDPLNVNTGFENGLDGWLNVDPDTGGTSVLTISTEHVHSGTYSLEAAGAPEDPTWAFFQTDPPAPVRPGIPFVVECFSYFTSDDAGIESTVDATIDFLDADGVQVANVAIEDRGPQDQWHRTAGLISTPNDPAIVSARLFIIGIAFPDFGERLWFDDVSLRYARPSLSSLSSDYGIPYNDGGTRPPTEVRAELRLRNRTVDYAAGTVTVEAATPDALVLDAALVSDVPVEPDGPTVRDCCNLVLGHVLGTAVQPGTTGSEPVEPEALAWQPGERAWSYLDSVVGQAGLRLWCDELGLWHLENPADYNVQGHVAMSAATLTGLRDGISRDRGQWADAVVVTYEWTDAAGERHTVHDVAGASGATRTIQMTIERPFPGYGLAGGRLRRAQAMGRTLDLDAVADYDTRPFKAVSVSTPAGTGLQTGTVSGVTWTQPDDTMTVRTRGIVTIGPNAWLYTPSGVAWDDDSLPGVSWENYRSTEEGL